MNRPGSAQELRHVEDQLAPWLLGELDPVAAAAVERHLDGCDACRAALAELDEALVATVETLPPQTPSAAVWDAIAARVAPVAPVAPPTQVGRSTRRARPPGVGKRAPQPPPRRAPGSRGGMLAALVAVVALAAFGAWQFRLAEIADAERLVAQGRLSAALAEVETLRQRGDALRTDQVAIATWLAQDDLRVVTIPAPGPDDAALGSVLVRSDGAALVVMRDPPAEGRDFQAWGVVGDSVVSLGAFPGQVIEVDAAGFDAVAISLEPPGGSDAPTDVLGAAATG